MRGLQREAFSTKVDEGGQRLEGLSGKTFALLGGIDGESSGV
jgi:hypothetical protein